jgi:hypothetical protein
LQELSVSLGPPPCRPVGRASVGEASASAPSGVSKATSPSTHGVQEHVSPLTPSGRSPTKTTRKCRKSVTNLANKAERRGICRVLGEDADRISERSRSLSPTSDASIEEEHVSAALGLTAEIREEARIRQRRNSSDYNKHALSPVLEASDDAPMSVTPARPRNVELHEGRHLLSPLPMLQQFQAYR